MRPLTLYATAAALVALPAAPATAAKPHVARLEVHGTGGPGAGLYGFRVDIRASRVAGRPATGTFRGTVAPGTGSTRTPDVITLAGPVTCLQVAGRTASLLYPLKDVTTVAGTQHQEGMSILITVTQGSPSRMGFSGPLPTASFGGRCAPAQTPLVLDGQVTVRP